MLAWVDASGWRRLDGVDGAAGARRPRGQHLLRKPGQREVHHLEVTFALLARVGGPLIAQGCAWTAAVRRVSVVVVMMVMAVVVATVVVLRGALSLSSFWNIVVRAVGVVLLVVATLGGNPPAFQVRQSSGFGSHLAQVLQLEFLEVGDAQSLSSATLVARAVLLAELLKQLLDVHPLLLQMFHLTFRRTGRRQQVATLVIIVPAAACSSF